MKWSDQDWWELPYPPKKNNKKNPHPFQEVTPVIPLHMWFTAWTLAWLPLMPWLVQVKHWLRSCPIHWSLIAAGHYWIFGKITTGNEPMKWSSSMAPSPFLLKTLVDLYREHHLYMFNCNIENKRFVFEIGLQLFSLSINLLIIFSINRRVVWSIKCQKILKHQCFPKPKMTSTKYIFSLRS